MELKLVLNELINKKYFNIELFNRRVSDFKYGFTEKRNKPSANFNLQNIKNVKDHKIKQKAAQCWCLIRAFPFIVNDLVPDDDECLKLISSLLRIMNFAFLSSFSESELGLFMGLIKEHLNMFKDLFPNINMINKHHNMLHYPKSIRQHGPLINYWCMRFEGKHNQLKQTAAVCNNFKNITKTVIIQHQFWASFSFIYPEQHEERIYKPGLIVCLGFGEIYPIYGHIIAINGSDLQCELIKIENFNTKLNAYCISKTHKRTNIKKEDLLDFRPNSIWRAYDNKSYLSPRTNLI